MSTSPRLTSAAREPERAPATFVKQWNPREKKALNILLVFSFAMILLPISGYFAFKHVLLEGIFGYADGAVGGAICSVVIIHILIAIYVILAFREEQNTKSD